MDNVTPQLVSPPAIKVFQLNDYECWFAPSLEEAIECAMKECGLSREDVVYDLASPCELTDEELDSRVFVWGDGEDERYSFRTELNARIAAGETCGLFSVQEW